MSRSVANMLLLLAGLVWGLGFIAQETAMEDVGPFIFMTLRFGIAALAVFPMAYVEHRKMGGLSSPVAALTSENWIAIVSVGVMFFLTMVFQQIGLLGTTVTNAGVLTGLYVVLTPLIAFFVLGHKQPNIVWPAALLAFGGIWLLGGGALDGLNWGDWLILCSAVFAALHVLTMGHAVKGVRRPATVATAQFAVSALLSAIGFGLARLFQWNIEPPVSLTALTEAAPEILFAALFAGAFAFFLMALC
ncbi:MAG: DMT family transporter [Rhizobiaceae bacterium]